MSATRPGEQVATLSGLEVVCVSGHILAQLTQVHVKYWPLPRDKKGVLHLARRRVGRVGATSDAREYSEYFCSCCNSERNYVQLMMPGGRGIGWQYCIWEPDTLPNQK